MRLHRLTLSNYRGIAHRDIEFPERGVTVVSGPNEIGKSSMIEALDLLLESKDRSAKKDVKQVKPTHADVGSEVTAEISTGPYRFVYRKRFHKKCETELTIIAPQREQLTGDQAHDRVRMMLAETVDTGLWQAQRVLQSASTSAVDLSGCDALSRALDIAASDSADTDLAAGLSSAEPLLIEKIDAEYARYFTATGRPTGEWASAETALRAADDEVARCAAAMAEIDEKVRRHGELSTQVAELTEARVAAAARLVAARSAAEQVAAVTEQHSAATIRATAAVATRDAAAAAHRERLRLRAEVTARAAAAAEAQRAADDADESETIGRAVVVEAQQAAQVAAQALQQARVRVDAARETVALVQAAHQAVRLAARLTRIDSAQAELDTVARRLRDISLTDRAFRTIETAAAAVEIVQAQADLVSPALQLRAEHDVEVHIGDRRVVLPAGETYDLTVADVTEIRVPGVLTTSISPGATAAETHEKLVAAQRVLHEALVGAGVTDVAAARALAHQRAELLRSRDQLTATVAGLLGDDDIDMLRAQLTALHDKMAGAPDIDADAADAELASATDDYATAEVACATQHKVAAAADAQLTQRMTAAAAHREKAAAARSEEAMVAQRLAALRAEAGDDDIAVAAQAAADTAAAAEQLVAELTDELAQLGAAEVTAELAAAVAADDAVGRDLKQVTQALRDIDVQLDTIGSQGRAGQLDAARIRREHAAAAHARVQTRAHAAKMLRSVMSRHRDDTRARYVEPFRAEVQRLGRTVFGSTFEVEVDNDLQIRSRTVAGRTVPFESLSGGAKEQLGIIARLAVAALVSRDDAVPVMIDDALGFTDPDRLTKMAAVFDAVGTEGQVIVLTCTSDRYRGIAAAHTVELTA